MPRMFLPWPNKERETKMDHRSSSGFCQEWRENLREGRDDDRNREGHTGIFVTAQSVSPTYAAAAKTPANHRHWQIRWGEGGERRPLPSTYHRLRIFSQEVPAGSGRGGEGGRCQRWFPLIATGQPPNPHHRRGGRGCPPLDPHWRAPLHVGRRMRRGAVAGGGGEGEAWSAARSVAAWAARRHRLSRRRDSRRRKGEARWPEEGEGRRGTERTREREKKYFFICVDPTWD